MITTILRTSRSSTLPKDGSAPAAITSELASLPPTMFCAGHKAPSAGRALSQAFGHVVVTYENVPLLEYTRGELTAFQQSDEATKHLRPYILNEIATVIAAAVQHQNRISR